MLQRPNMLYRKEMDSRNGIVLARSGPKQIILHHVYCTRGFKAVPRSRDRRKVLYPPPPLPVSAVRNFRFLEFFGPASRVHSSRTLCSKASSARTIAEAFVNVFVNFGRGSGRVDRLLLLSRAAFVCE